MESWLPLTGRIIGDMRSPEPWAELIKILETTWLDRDGNGWRPVLSALDVQGDYYAEALAFIRAHSWRLKLRAIRGWAPAGGKGITGIGLLRNTYTDKNTLTKVQNIDVDAAKTMLATMLSRSEPGPGYIHLPSGRNGQDVGGWDLETLAELTAEYRRQMPSKGGYTRRQWFKRPGRPNHRLDCAAYALAALAMSRLKIDTCDLQRIEARELEKQQKEKPAGESYEQPIRYGAINPVTGQVEQSPRREFQWGVQPTKIFDPSGW
jgi:phage terminase large subunit GpA-like protein